MSYKQPTYTSIESARISLEDEDFEALSSEEQLRQLLCAANAYDAVIGGQCLQLFKDSGLSEEDLSDDEQEVLHIMEFVDRLYNPDDYFDAEEEMVENYLKAVEC